MRFTGRSGHTSHSSTLCRRESEGRDALHPESEKTIIYVIITIITIAANAATAIATFARAKFVVANFGEVNVPDAWVPALATVQLAGAAGLAAGLFGIPAFGVAAAVGLVLFFTGAVVTHLRARAYRSLPSPVLFLALAAATLALMLA